MVLASVESKLGRFLTRRVWGLRLTGGGWGRRICRGTIERDMKRINGAISGAGRPPTLEGLLRALRAALREAEESQGK